MIYPIKLGGGEYRAYGEPECVEDDMRDSDWKIGNGKEGEIGKHYCSDCWTYDDEDNFVLNPKK